VEKEKSDMAKKKKSSLLKFFVFIFTTLGSIKKIYIGVLKALYQNKTKN